MLDEKFEAFTFSPSGASVYHLGNFGTARKLLHSWELKGCRPDLMKAGIVFVLTNYTLTFPVNGLCALRRRDRSGEEAGQAVRRRRKALAWHVLGRSASAISTISRSWLSDKRRRPSSAGRTAHSSSKWRPRAAFFRCRLHAAFRSFDLRLAAIVGPSLFMLGAAGGHVYQMVTQHNFAPGNAGVIFYMDIVIPLFGLLLLWLQHRYGRPRQPSPAP